MTPRAIRFAVAGILATTSLLGVVAQDTSRSPQTPSPLPRATRRIVASDRGRQWPGVVALCFSTNGQHLAWAEANGTVRVWHTTAGHEIVRIGGGPGRRQKGLSLSPDGRFLATARSDQAANSNEIADYELSTGRELVALPIRTAMPGFGVGGITFAPDSKTLAAACYDGLIRTWDVEAISELKPIEWGAPCAENVAFSPDGSQIAAANDRHEVKVWDFRLRKRLHSVGSERGLGACCLAYATDGRYLAVGGYAGLVTLWHARTGESLDELRAEPIPARGLAFAADGRALAVAYADETIRLWELASGRERASWKTPDAGRVVAFAPEGGTLAAGTSDGTVLIWGVRDVEDSAAMFGDTNAAWAVLADRDASAAYRAMCGLMVDRAGRLASLRRQMERAVIGYDSATTKRWIAQLGSERFSEREKATAELRRMSYFAETELRSALTSTTSPEARTRIVRILTSLSRPAEVPELLRLTRCLEVLEWDASDESKRLLRDLATRFPESQRAKDAEGSLRRLRQRLRSRAARRQGAGVGYAF